MKIQTNKQKYYLKSILHAIFEGAYSEPYLRFLKDVFLNV